MIKEFIYKVLGVTAQYPLAGFDTSEGPGRLDWNKIALMPDMNFCGFRACLAKNTDDLWEYNYTNSNRIGMPWMGYFAPLFSQDWKVQTDYYLGLLDAAGGSPMPPVLDVEDKYNPLNKTDTLSWLEKSAWRIENATGRKPIVYTRKSYWNYRVEQGDYFKHCMDWLAQYNQVIPAPTEIPNDWVKVIPTWTLWQDWNKMSGIPFGTNANLDHNWFNGNDSVFLSKMGCAPYHAPIQPPPVALCDGVPLCMTVLQDGLKIRNLPNKDATIIGTLSIGEVLNVINVGGTQSWIQHSRGWSNVIDGIDINMKKFEG